MSVQAALGFIARLRVDDALRRRAAAPGDAPPLDDLVALGAAAGFGFTAEELRRAHGYDWGMRWARHAAADRPAPNADFSPSP